MDDLTMTRRGGRGHSTDPTQVRADKRQLADSPVSLHRIARLLPSRADSGWSSA